jgi:hypothetical protein
VKLQSEHDNCRHDDNNEDRADQPTATTTLACLFEEELGIDFLDKGLLIKQGHDHLSVVRGLVIMRDPR